MPEEHPHTPAGDGRDDAAAPASAPGEHRSRHSRHRRHRRHGHRSHTPRPDAILTPGRSSRRRPRSARKLRLLTPWGYMSVTPWQLLGACLLVVILFVLVRTIIDAVSAVPDTTWDVVPVL